MGTDVFTKGSSNSEEDEERFGKIYDRRVVARAFGYILPHRGLVAVAMVAMLAFSASQVAVPWIIKIGIDDYISVGNVAGLWWVAALFLGNALLGLVAAFTLEYSLAIVGQRILYRLRADMFSHLQKLSLRFFDKTEVGRTMSRVLGDVFQLQEFLPVAVMTVGELLSLAGIVAAVLLLSWQLGLVAMAILPALVIVVAVWQPLARKAFTRVRRAISTVNGALNENITGVRVVQSMNRQERNLGRFDEMNHEHMRATLSASRLSAGMLPTVDTLTAVSIALVIVFGSRMVSGASMEAGTLIAFILYIQRFFDPIRNLTMQYTQMQRAMASGARIFELLDTEPDLVDAPDAEELPRLRGEVELKNVSYSYVPGLDVLTDVSLHIRPGETAAIVGPTGAGKTTLVSLISRFYDVSPTRGAVLVDGHDVRDETRRSLASQMSVVLQEPFLFSGTVRENIKYNHTHATDEQMKEAATAVGAHDFIERLEDGYDTYLHERGVNLSVGQRQLLSFARAIVADPRILILDEATANIDSYTEMLIQQALQKLLHGRTAIVIAHRLSTIRGADKIVALNHGVVEEIGTHQELMDSGGLYAHLYQMNYASMEEPLPASTNGTGGNGHRPPPTAAP